MDNGHLINHCVILLSELCGSVICSSTGTCTTEGESTKCECDPGYEGDTCGQGNAYGIVRNRRERERESCREKNIERERKGGRV